MKKFYLIVFLVAFGFFLFGEAKAGADENVFGWAWSENIGWISFNNLTGGGSIDYGVNISSDGVLSGYAWSRGTETQPGGVGWISFNEADLAGCPASPCRAEVDLATGQVSGWARALTDGGGWSGWIKLRGIAQNGEPYGVWIDKNNPTIIDSQAHYQFKGWAWSDMVIGWISFNCLNRDVCATSNYKVTTTFPFDQESPSVSKLYITSTLAKQTYPIKVKKDKKYTLKVDVTDNLGIDTDPASHSCRLYIDWIEKGPMFCTKNCQGNCTPDSPCTFIADFTFNTLGTYGGNYVKCRDIANNLGEGGKVDIEVGEVVNQPPVITSGPEYTTSPCISPTTQENCLVNFKVQASDPDGDILSYSWDVGDGNTYHLQNPSHHYQNPSPDPPGYYLAKVTVSDGKGGKAEASVQVPVKNPTLFLAGCAFKTETPCLNPFSGPAPLNDVDLKGNVGGTMFGTIDYKFYCREGGDLICQNTTNNYNYTLSQCIADTGQGSLCNYAEVGQYSAKISVNRGTGSASAKINIKATELATECQPGLAAICISPQGCGHTIYCQEDGTWPACPTDQCLKGTSQSCGNCGTKTCNDKCQWNPCSGEGVCSPGQIQACDSGTQTCQSNCQWGICQGIACNPGETQSCGKGGTQTCQEGGVWGPCTGEGECYPGEVRSCDSGTQTCQSDYSWGTCTGIGCLLGSTQSCGRCGTQTCQPDQTWGPCQNQGICYPGQNSPSCPCPEDDCQGSTFYDYPDFGNCSSDCSCQACLATITENDPRCLPSLAVDLKLATDSTNWTDNLAGNFPIENVDFQAKVIGTTSGTVTFKFYSQPENLISSFSHLDISSPDSDWVLRVDDQGVARMTRIFPEDTFGVEDLWTYSEPGSYNPKVVIERGNQTSFDTGKITAENEAPSVSNFSFTHGDYCFSPWPPVHLKWQFSDPGDSQSAYQIQIDDDSDFSSPVIDTKRVSSPSQQYAPPNFGDIHLNFSTPYYWRVKVWDSYGAESIFVEGPSFITESASPWPDFSWIPRRPAIGEKVQFIDKTSCYNDPACPASYENYSWDFGDETSQSGMKNPAHSYSALGRYNVGLQVCSGGKCCLATKSLLIAPPLPEWEEVPPF